MVSARDNDQLLRFMLERAGVRGAIVRLVGSWAAIGRQSDYPAAIAALLGESVAASALFTSHIKTGTSMSIQLRAAGPLTSLYCECSGDGELRGLAHWTGPCPEQLALTELVAPAHLAMTLAQPDGQRYQGLVPLESARLDRAFEGYFARSEQLPTRVRLSAEPNCSVGIMIQQLPGQGGTAPAPDPDGWNRACLLLDTLQPEELLEFDPTTILHRLFHQETVRLFAPRPLRFGCRCSQLRVEQMLHHLGRSETEAVLEEQGRVEVTCEFCNRQYHFDRVDLERIHSDSAVPGTETRQ